MATASLGVRERMAAAVEADRPGQARRPGGHRRHHLRRHLHHPQRPLHLRLHLRRGAAALPGREGRAARRRSPLPGATDAAHAAPLAVGVDEYQRYLYDVTPDGRVVFFRARGRGAPPRAADPRARGRHRDRRVAQPAGGLVAAGTRRRPGGARSRCASGPCSRSRPSRTSRWRCATAGAFEVDPQRRPVREVSYQESAEGETVGRRARGRRRRSSSPARPRRPTAKHAPPPALETVRTKPGDAITARAPRPRGDAGRRHRERATSTTGRSAAASRDLTDVDEGRAPSPSPRSSAGSAATP